MTGGAYLLLRRGGSVWALASAAVRTVRGSRGDVRVALRAGDVRADEVIGFARDLAVRRPGALVLRLWPERCVGLAVHAGVPVVVIDPEAPPPALRGEGALTHDQ